MLDALAVINRVIEEHRRIRGNLKQAGASVADIETLFTLHKVSAGWSQSSVKEIADKQAELSGAVDLLWKGLRQHFGFEENTLPGVLEEAVMKTILEEHKKIAGMISGFKTSLTEGWPEGLDQPQMLTRKAMIQQSMHQIIEAVEEHSQYEEAILNGMKTALEA
jgi:hypothetical protein